MIGRRIGRRNPGEIRKRMIGKKIGPYEIKERLGKGSLGTPWLATDTDSGRKVMLRTISRGFGERDFQEFWDRWDVLRALDHPGIISVYDCGEEEDFMYAATEYVEGKSLADLIRSGPLPIDDACRIGTELADTLAYLHEQQLLHNNITAPSVRITRSGHAVITDLALVQQRGEVTRGLVGIPSYLSPEVATNQPPTDQSDIYMLGVVMYEMLTGVLPFRGKPWEIALKITNENAPPLEEQRSGIPPGLRMAVMKALEKDPGHRHRTALELADELRQHAGPATSGLPGSPRGGR